MKSCVDRKTRPEISVILPMHNAAAYVDTLMHDMLQQTFRNVEFICIDDGSTDVTGERLRCYQEQDQRIHYVRTENGGAGAARNEGLRMAQGTYAIWLDADDRYRENLLEKLYEAAKCEDADIAICAFDRINHWLGTEEKNVGFNQKMLPLRKAFSGMKIRNFLRYIDQGPINKLYRLSFVVGQGIEFSSTHIANDCFFTLMGLMKADRIVCIPDALLTVQRYINPDSVSAMRAMYLVDVVTVFDALFDRVMLDHHLQCYMHQIVFLFQAGFHYNAQYAVDSYYVNAMAKTLLEKPPFLRMRLEAIQERMRLNPVPIQNRIRELEAQQGQGNVEEKKSVEISLQFKQNLLANVLALNDKLIEFKQAEIRSGWTRRIRSIWYRVAWSIQDNGVWVTFLKMSGRLVRYVERVAGKLIR